MEGGDANGVPKLFQGARIGGVPRVEQVYRYFKGPMYFFATTRLLHQTLLVPVSGLLI